MRRAGRLPALLLSAALIALSACGHQVTGTSYPPPERRSDLSIHREGETEARDSFDVEEGASIRLAVSFEGDPSGITFSWKIADEAVATVEAGLVTGVRSGETTLEVKANEDANLRKIAFINVLDKIVQDGVGSGRSADDPVFKGNEGRREPLEIYFVEMQRQYGDALYLRKGALDVLIDGGTRDDGGHVKDFLQDHMRDDRLDLVINTHAHEDHYGGMPEALSAVNHVSLFLDAGGSDQTTYTTRRDTFIGRGSTWHTAYDCVNGLNEAVKKYYLTDELTVEVLDTGAYAQPTESTANPESLAALFRYKDFSFYTAGDLTTASENSLMQHENLPRVTLYKASHHGSNGSNSTALLNKLDPEWIGISAAIVGSDKGAGQTGVKGHPAADAVRRFYQAPNIAKDLNVYWNGVNGDMRFATYGVKGDVTFRGSPTLKGYYELVGGSYVKVTGEDDLRFHETKAFKARGYDQYLPPSA